MALTIAFMCWRSKRTASIQLADTGADAWGGRYSPSRGEILFYTGTEDAWRVMRVPLSGGSSEQLLSDGFSNSTPDWC